MREYKKFPYRVEFPSSSETSRNSQTLEDSLFWARWTLNRVWKEDVEWGRQGEPTTDAETAVITNRNTGYRWILRRMRFEVEFQTPEMVEELVAKESIDVHLSVEEAEALARAVKSLDIKDKRASALVDQALDQIGLLCRQVRERVRNADHFIDAWSRGIPRSFRSSISNEQPPQEETTDSVRHSYRPLGDPDNLSLKEAGEILGKARNTLYVRYRKGKFPPVVDVGPHLGNRKPVLVVPRYRLEAWLAGERMPNILQDVFEFQFLKEPPWGCWLARKDASDEDISFWVEKRGFKRARTSDGKGIYGEDLEEERTYDPKDPTD